MKKLLSVFLAVVMCVTAIFTVTSVSAYDTKATDSDSNVIVKFSGSTLLIEGYGDMPNYEHSPWEKIRSDIQKIVVGKDITSIGVGNFSGMANLTNVKFESGSKLKKTVTVLFIMTVNYQLSFCQALFRLSVMMFSVIVKI